jgi:TonB family protein
MAYRIGARLTMATTIGLLLTIASVRVVPTYAKQSRESQAGAVTRTAVESRATLTGTVYDPLGAPVEGLLVYIESGAFGSGATDETRTDKDGQYTFERLPPGVYSISSPVDFAPVIVVSLDAGQRVRQDIRMHIEEVTSVYSICVDCGPALSKYVPPESIVNEFANDRTAAASHAIIGAEPAAGWEYYEPDVRITETIRDRGLTGTVVLEARVETDGAIRNVSIVSSPHAELSAAAEAALQNERWRAASVHGVPVAVPLRLTIEFLRRGGRR